MRASPLLLLLLVLLLGSCAISPRPIPVPLVDVDAGGAKTEDAFWPAPEDDTTQGPPRDDEGIGGGDDVACDSQDETCGQDVCQPDGELGCDIGDDGSDGASEPDAVGGAESGDDAPTPLE